MQMHNKIVRILIRLYLFLKFHFCFVVEAARWLNFNLFGFSRVEAFFLLIFASDIKKLIFDLWSSKHNTTSLFAFYVFIFSKTEAATGRNYTSVSVEEIGVFPSVRCSFLKLLEFQAFAYNHAVGINFQRIYFQIYFLLLLHLRVQKVAKSCFWLKIESNEFNF